ncbi:hypothetical protein [Streptomyces sp. NPDC002088]|uniref:hypothetical protein n=1 Tax=Streptomyces sp. NPDC002088 TaxID=3154665 RepID=UPI0033202A86
MNAYKIKSDTWGWLDAATINVDGPFLRMTDVTRDGKPFYAECMIPVTDAKLIIPPSA